MLDDRSKMRNGDMPLLDRIDVALRRVTSGQGQMRVPVEATDPDIVLADCKREIERLREALTAANAQAEHFEREWYLRGDEIERLRAELAESKQDAARWRTFCERSDLSGDILIALEIWGGPTDSGEPDPRFKTVVQIIDDAMRKEGE